IDGAGELSHQLAGPVFVDAGNDLARRVAPPRRLEIHGDDALSHQADVADRDPAVGGEHDVPGEPQIHLHVVAGQPHGLDLALADAVDLHLVARGQPARLREAHAIEPGVPLHAVVLEPGHAQHQDGDRCKHGSTHLDLGPATHARSSNGVPGPRHRRPRRHTGLIGPSLDPSMNWRRYGLGVFRTSSRVPENTTFPSNSMAMRSPTLNALLRSWVTMIDVT